MLATLLLTELRQWLYGRTNSTLHTHTCNLYTSHTMSKSFGFCYKFFLNKKNILFCLVVRTIELIVVFLYFQLKLQLADELLETSTDVAKCSRYLNFVCVLPNCNTQIPVENHKTKFACQWMDVLFHSLFTILVLCVRK